MSNCEFIQSLINKKYIVYNVNSAKLPILGRNDEGWSKITFDKTEKYRSMDSEMWGMRTGIQENGDFIIGLDFDMWYKSKGKYIESENTRNLYKEFENLNINKDGIFSSSTELNRGCIVDVSNSLLIKDMLSKNGKGKIEKNDYHLEILANFNMVLPPSATKCKIRKTVTDKRSFLGEKYILEIEENTELETFIYDYIFDATNIKEVSKSDLRSKETKEVYLNYLTKNESNEVIINDTELLKPFIDKINIERVRNYNEWYKIGYAIKNTYGDNGLNLFKYFSMKEGDIDPTIDSRYNSWSSDKYPLLNSNYIINCVKQDNPSLFIALLLNYEIQLNTKNYKKKKIEFEKVVRKVLEPAIWIKKNRIRNEWEYTDFMEINHIYKELKQFGSKFINEYNIDDEKNYYDTVDFIPDHNFKEESEGMKTFNMFKGFEIQKYKPKKKITRKEEYIKVFKDHLKNLCNNDDNSYNMLEQWIAHIILNPNKRSLICIILQGIEGTGKTSLYELIRSIMGDSFCFSTARPEKTIFSQFNSCLKNKILVNLNEPNFNSFKEGFDEFKSLITDQKFSLEEKGRAKIELSNYMWFILTTNNEKLFPLSTTDRRFFFMKTSDLLAGNVAYFNKLNECFTDKDFQHTIFNYLKEVFIENYDFQHIQRTCKTQYHKTLIEGSKNPFFQFLQEFIEDDENDSYINDDEGYEITPKKLIEIYKKYCRDNDINKMDNGMSIKSKLLRINESCYKRIDNKRYYVLTSQEIISFLKTNKLYKE